MTTTTDAPTAKKGAYQRPYKTRSQRREQARRKYDENSDQKFLVRVAVGLGVLILIAIGIAVKSYMEPQETAPAPIEAVG